MKILLTGASSYLGARLYFDLQKDFDIIGTYNAFQLSKKFVRLNITREKEVDEIIKKYHPDIIIHAAANADARWCEANPSAAVLLNETATRYIVDAANEINAKVIYISTSRVIKPADVYAKTKYNSEQIVKTTKNSWVILRPSYILGFSPNTINDRPFNRILRNLDKDSLAIYDTSWKFQVTYIGHVSEIIKAVIDKGINRQNIPVATIELKSRYDTVRDILTPFNIAVTPINKHDTSFVTRDNLSKLRELNLPMYTYPKIIEKIVEEIRNRDKFRL